MRLDFKRSTSPDPFPNHARPRVVPINADTGQEIDYVTEASVVSKHGKASLLTLTVILREDVAPKEL